MLGIFGEISKPSVFSGYDLISTEGKGLSNLLSSILAIIITLAGIFVLVNFILAGYAYLSANNQPQKLAAAGNKMLQSLIGLLIIAAGYVIAAAVGYIFFQDAGFLLNPIFQSIKLAPSSP